MGNKSVFKSRMERKWRLAKFFFSELVQEKTMKFKKIKVLGAGAFSCSDLEITNERLRSAANALSFINHFVMRFR